MGTTSTTNLVLIKPNPFEEEDSWGPILNTNWDTVAALFDAGPVLKLSRGGTGAGTAALAIQNLDTAQFITSSAGTTTLTNTSPRNAIVTGSTTHTIVLPVVTTLSLGWTIIVHNLNSSGTVTVQSSGLNAFTSQNSGMSARYICVAVTGTGIASWRQVFEGSDVVTGSGSLVYNYGPTMSRIRFTAANVVTAGTNAQGQGALSETFNVITTAAANPSGVTLPAPSSTATTSTWVRIVNRGANPVNVYPATGHSIDSLAANASVQIPVNGVVEFFSVDTNKWYSSINDVTGELVNLSVTTEKLADGAVTAAKIASGVIPAAFPSGTRMLFQQTAAPTGWTKDTTQNDKALRVVSGAVGSGGTVAFSTAFASRGFSGTTSPETVTGTVGSTTLDISQIPSHTHYVASGGGAGAGALSGANYVDFNYFAPTSAYSYTLYGTPAGADRGLASYNGGSGGHTHTFSGGAHAHSFSGAIDMAVQYVDLIIASKD